MTGYNDNLWANARSLERKRELKREQLHQMFANVGRALAGVVEAFGRIGKSARSSPPS
jgi:hypothetical protein